MLTDRLYDALGMVGLRRRSGTVLVTGISFGVVRLFGLLKEVVDAVRLRTGESDNQKRREQKRNARV
jgi:hypothetical protein